MPVSPQCPRCAYDLSGHSALWESACPLRGRCPECGLDFAWGAVMNPGRADIPGFVEHARTRWGFVGRSLRTLLWALLPWVFWKRVRLEGRVRPAHAWLWLLVTLGSLHVVASSLGCAAFYVIYTDLAATFAAWGRAYPPPGWEPYASKWTLPVISIERWLAIDSGPALLPVLFHIGFVAILLVLPRSMHMARVRFTHVQRAIVYGFAWLIFFSILRAGAGAVVLITTPSSGASLPLPIFWFAEYALDPLWCFLGAGVWIAVWWLCALWRGWRMHMAFVVWLLVTTASLLLSLVVTLAVGDAVVLLRLARLLSVVAVGA